MRNLLPILIAVGIVITVTLTSASTNLDLNYGAWNFSDIKATSNEAINQTLDGEKATCNINQDSQNVTMTFVEAGDETETPIGVATSTVTAEGCETTVTGSADAEVTITDNTNTGSEV